MSELVRTSPELKSFVIRNKAGNDSVEFSDPKAVRALNRALLMHYYDIKFWDIPEDYLCPPIPGRADYIHFAADLIGRQGAQVRVLDIGVGANCIYPLLGHKIYGWSFVGSDISDGALAAAATIVKGNSLLQSIELRKQTTAENIFKGVIFPDDNFELTICNPPFHPSAQEARNIANRKLKNLGMQRDRLNFGGKDQELWCKGGEIEFVSRMIRESEGFRHQVRYFSSLISKEGNLPKLLQLLKQLKATDIKTIDMSQGQKKSRILAWSWRELPQQ